MLNFFATQEKQAPNYNLEKSKVVWNLVHTKIDKGVISDQNLPRDKETKASCAGIQSDLSKTVNLPKYEGPGQVSSIMKVRRHTHNDQDQVRELPCWCRPQSRVERPPPRRRRGTSGSLSLRYHTHYCIVTQGVPKKVTFWNRWNRSGFRRSIFFGTFCIPPSQSTNGNEKMKKTLEARRQRRKLRRPFQPWSLRCSTSLL